MIRNLAVRERYLVLPSSLGDDMCLFINVAQLCVKLRRTLAALHISLSFGDHKVCLTCLQILATWTEQYGPVFRWRLGPEDVLVITDPLEVLKLCSKEANLPKYALAYKAANSVSSLPQSGLLHHQHIDLTSHQLLYV